MNVFVRDFGQVTPIVLQILFWLTPIIYPLSIIPEGSRHWLNLNPMYHFTNTYQGLIVYGRSPQIEVILILISTTGFLLLFSFLLFRRASEEMVDVL
jgi:lipopolysaccharide transport system permease protein